MPVIFSPIIELFTKYSSSSAMQNYQNRIRIEREVLRAELARRNEQLEIQVRDLQEEAYFRHRLHIKRMAQCELEIQNAFYKELSESDGEESHDDQPTDSDYFQ